MRPTSAPWSLWLLWCVWSAALGTSSADVYQPSANIVVQALTPTGIRISVPDTPGMRVVVINANVNFPIGERETGQVSGNVLEGRNGYWSLEAKDIQLKPGDVVFYYVHTTAGGINRVEGLQAIHELVDPSCGPSPTTFNGRPACAGQLIFEDNFDTFNTSIWKHFIQFSDEPDYDFATYTDNPENSFVKDGTLHLKATVLAEDELLKHTKLEKCTWKRGGSQYCERSPVGWDILPPTRSAMLTTKGTFSFKFGRMDIRAKAAAGEWLMSRIQLDPQTGKYGHAPFESGRVEIMRVRGNADITDPSGIQGGAQRNDPQIDIHTCNRRLSIYRLCHLKPSKRFSDEMYVFSVIWTPQHMTIKVADCEHVITPPDGSFLKHEYFRENCNNSPYEKGTHFVPFDEEFYVQFYLLPGGFYLYHKESKSNGVAKPWNDEDPKGILKFWQSHNKWLPTWISDMEVDYIKVWAL